jgi:hypothetical protein
VQTLPGHRVTVQQHIAVAPDAAIEQRSIHGQHASSVLQSSKNVAGMLERNLLQRHDVCIHCCGDVRNANRIINPVSAYAVVRVIGRQPDHAWPSTRAQPAFGQPSHTQQRYPDCAGNQ